MKNFFLTLLVVGTLTSCASNTIIAEPSDAQINTESAKAYAEIKSKSKFSSNAKWTAMVQRVAKRIEIASGEPFEWEAVLIESPEVNAWCMPGGKIAVYTGIMPILQNEAALAAVMGHEVAHATLRHGKQQYVRSMQGHLAGTLIGGAAVLGGQILCKTEDCKRLSSLGGLAATFTITFMERKFSREDETSADREGQLLMAKAGYDPNEAPKLWTRMSQSKGNQSPPEWMSTHPSDSHRKNKLNEWMAEAQDIYQKAPTKYGLGAKIVPN